MPEVPRPRGRGTKTPKPEPTPEPNGETTGTADTPDSALPPAPKRLSPADAKLRESVKGMYEGVALLAMGVGMARQSPALSQFASTLMEPAQVLMGFGEDGSPVVGVADPRTGADKIADAWIVAADRNPRVKQALKKVTEGGALAEVAALHVTLLLPFLPGIPGLAFLGGSPAAADNGTH